MLEKLKESIEANNFAMQNIADSTESTAQQIQKQARMCASIQESSDMAEQDSNRVTSLEVRIKLATKITEEPATAKRLFKYKIEAISIGNAYT